VLVGVDGYRLDYVPDSGLPIPVAADSVLLAARGGADRATLRASSTLRLGDPDGPAEGTLTFAAEHSVLRQRTLQEHATLPGPGGHGPATVQDQWVVGWTHDTGILAQASGAWRSTLYGTAGVRFERNDAFADALGIQALPMLGAAYVRQVGAAQVKLRTAFGRGIRAPQTPAREHARLQDRGWAIGLSPESQSGVEVGAEVYVGRSFSLQATRFDQTASGLMQNVLLGIDTVSRNGVPMRRAHYELQNVGAITNRGWEMQAAAARGPVSLGGTLSLVDSRVKRIVVGYGGDLRPGDRMLAVPARTATVTAQWNGLGWTGALTAARAWDWINYDRLALARAYAENLVPARDLSGAQLRAFWRPYDGTTDLRAAFSRQVRPGLWLELKADNLLGNQLGEPDDVTIRAGRSFTLGARATF
jgi:iron complex outermembrane receptor protein